MPKKNIFLFVMSIILLVQACIMGTVLLIVLGFGAGLGTLIPYGGFDYGATTAIAVGAMIIAAAILFGIPFWASLAGLKAAKLKGGLTVCIVLGFIMVIPFLLGIVAVAILSSNYYTSSIVAAIPSLIFASAVPILYLIGALTGTRKADAPSSAPELYPAGIKAPSEYPTGYEVRSPVAPIGYEVRSPVAPPVEVTPGFTPRFDPMTGEPLAPPTTFRPRFDPMTGEPLTPEVATIPTYVAPEVATAPTYVAPEVAKHEPSGLLKKSGFSKPDGI